MVMETAEGSKGMRGRGRGARGRGRGRGASRARGRGRGRGKKIVKAIESDEEMPLQPQPEDEVVFPEVIEEDKKNFVLPSKIDLEADISQLEAPTFTTLTRGPPEPMLRLRWDHRVNLMGEKVLNPMIHCCDKCLKPILIYGRMIPCKHVFCMACGRREDKVCPRCLDKVARVEQTGLGTVFMCTHDGTRYGNAGCRRTYLSQRDLQAHINHRHMASDTSMSTESPHETTKQLATVPRPKHIPTAVGDPRVQHIGPPVAQHRRSPPQSQQAFIPHRSSVMQAYTTPPPSTQQNQRTNLITVPIQDNPATHVIMDQGYHHYQQQGYVGYNVPPPQPTYYTTTPGVYAPQSVGVTQYSQPPPTGQPLPRPQYQEQQYSQPPPQPQQQWHQPANNQFYR